MTSQHTTPRESQLAAELHAERIARARTDLLRRAWFVVAVLEAAALAGMLNGHWRGW